MRRRFRLVRPRLAACTYGVGSRAASKIRRDRFSLSPSQPIIKYTLEMRIRSTTSSVRPPFVVIDTPARLPGVKYSAAELVSGLLYNAGLAAINAAGLGCIRSGSAVRIPNTLTGQDCPGMAHTSSSAISEGHQLARTIDFATAASMPSIVARMTVSPCLCRRLSTLRQRANGPRRVWHRATAITEASTSSRGIHGGRKAIARPGRLGIPSNRLLIAVCQ